MADHLVDRQSETYKEFARLYQVARSIRPSSIDRWNGDLYSHDEDPWGGFIPKTGAMRLSQGRVLDHLGASSGADPEKQAQALATILHESKHARTEMDAPDEPNAVRQAESIALDEGLVEHQTVRDFDNFVSRTGYPPLDLNDHQHKGAYEAVEQLSAHAAGPEGNLDVVVDKALETPVVMRMDAIADEIIASRLGDVVPQDPEHQQAARAALINQMSAQGWRGLRGRPAAAGELVGHDVQSALRSTEQKIQDHYRSSPDQPYPAAAPNQKATVNQAAARNLGNEQQRAVGPTVDLNTEQQRTMPSAAPARQSTVDLTKLPAPHAGAQVGGPAAGHSADQTQPKQPASSPELRFLSGQAPAGGAVAHTPNLGDGSRGRATAPSGPGRSPAARTEPGDRGRD